MRQRGGSEQPVKGRRADKPKARTKARTTAAPSVAGLQKQVGILTRELKEALERQTATAEVLQVINSSSGRIEPVFAAMLEKATQLCGAAFGILWLRDGEQFRAAALHGAPAAYAEIARKPARPLPTNPLGRMLRGERVIVSADVADEEPYRAGDPVRRALVDLAGARSAIQVALLKDDVLQGSLTVYRQEVRPFSENQIAVLQNFAAQAVIAMENVQLLTETREALERQSATAEVLQVINSSPGDLAPVFETILEKAHSLCAVAQGALLLYDGEKFRAVAVRGLSEAFAAHLRQGIVVGPNLPHYRLLEGARFVQVPDWAEIDDPIARGALGAGIRTTLFIPLRREGRLLGYIAASRPDVRPFTEKEIALLENFAAQAVIAMENARLITETREALEQQTATAEVLKVINASPGNLAPVFDAMLENATRLCEAPLGHVWLFDGELLHAVAVRGDPGFTEWLQQHSAVPPIPGSAADRIVCGKDIVHVADRREEEAYASDPVFRGLVDASGVRASLSVALRRDRTLLGMINVYRQELRPFSDNQIALLQNFAAQAVVAMENARLITETREALERQTATAEVLQVINASPGNLAPVFAAILDKALGLCGAAFGALWTFDGELMHAAATRGMPPAMAEFLTRSPHPVGRDNAHARLLRGELMVHIADVADDKAYQSGDAIRRVFVEQGGGRTLVAVPLLKDNAFLGDFVIYRQEVKPFSDKQIALLQNFAAQAVIAMENARLLTETREALEQQTATAEVLQVINSSPGDLAPVFDAILQKAHALIGPSRGTLFLFDGEMFRAVARHGYPDALPERANTIAVSEDPRLAALFAGEHLVHVPDLTLCHDPVARAVAESGGVRTNLLLPLRKDGVLLGVLSCNRPEVHLFTEKQIALLQNFAAQAVIAIENARLLTETREALERQTATAEVLQVINSSPGDLAPVFEAMLDKALGLCGAAFGTLWTCNGEQMHAAANRGMPPAMAEFLTRSPHPVGQNNAHARLLHGEPIVHLADVRDDEAYRSGDPVRRVLVELGGGRTMLAVPLLKDKAFLGDFVIYRQEVKPFSDKQIALLQNFAAQAVIAMENARLLSELRSRTSDLQESLEYQTAISDVLKVMSRSAFDLQPILDTLVETAARLCQSDTGLIAVRDGDVYRGVATFAYSPEYAQHWRTLRLKPTRATITGRVAIERQVIHIVDVTTDLEYFFPESIKLGKNRTLLGVPLLREGEPIGVISFGRERVEPFTERQIELVRTFADQAVIAMENARLITETREALERQTATAEVLQVINSSPGDLAPVFDAILEKAHSLCGVSHGSLQLYDGEKFRAVAVHGIAEAFASRLREGVSLNPSPQSASLLEGARFVQIPDLGEVDDPISRAAFELAGLRTVLFLPLRKDGALLGRISASRREVKPFAEKEIALLESFAAQAVIAMENARLLEEIRHRNDELAEALEFQTASGEVLRIVASSPENLQPVFDAMLEKAIALCDAKFGTLFLYDGNTFSMVADRNLPPAYAKVLRGQSFSPEANSAFGHQVETKAPLHLTNMFADSSYARGEPLRVAAIELGGVRSFVGVPLLRKGELIGTFSIYRGEPGGFVDNQIALVTTFADQAVIAIENGRLLGELRHRTAELARSVDELTATGDVLKIISRSSVELEAVLDTLVETVARLCRADHANLFRRRDDMYHLMASHGLSQEVKEFIVAHPSAPGRGSLNGRVAMEHRAVHIPDVLQDPEYTYQGQKIQGYRTMLGVPLQRGDALIGIFAINRTRVEPFTDKEIELATTFADQAVIAIENARLFDELRDRQAELRVTFDNMGDGVVMFDAAGRLTAWNRNFQELIELPESFLVGRPTRAEYFRYLADRGEFVSADLEAQLGRTVDDTGLQMRYERTRPDGRTIEVRRNPVPGGGFVLIYADITERKRAEQAIRAARDAAETALRELQAAQASLVHAQKMAALGQLTAGIAHEIKNPLNFVNNFAGLSVELLEELKGATVEAIGSLDSGKRAEILDTIGMLTGNLEKIAEHGRRADGIVRGMLQHARGSSGDWQATDLNALVEESLNLAYHGARAQDQDFKVTLELDLDRNLTPIEVVSEDVSRVLLNVISNGFYAVTRRARDGDGAFHPLLKIATRESGEGVEIRVRDNGVGISPEHCEKLFQPFFTTKPTGEGTGLGLSISYEIITQQHGGTIAVDSEVGRFSEFTVWLPRRRHGVACRNDPRQI